MPHRPAPLSLSSGSLAGVLSAALACLGVAALAPPALAAGDTPQAAPSSAADPTTRVDLPALGANETYPYTIEVPVNWGPRRDLPAPGALLGPPSGTPESNPEMLLVHVSKVVLSDPDAILGNLKAAAANADWSLEKGEVEDFGGTRGLWIVRRLPPENLHGDRVNYAVKLPLPEGSLDVTATVPADQLDALRPKVERMLHSIRPVEAEKAENPPKSR